MSEIYTRSPFNQPLISGRFENGRYFIKPKLREDLVVKILYTSRSSTPDVSRKELLVRVGMWQEFDTFPGLRIPQFNIVLGEATYPSFDEAPPKNLYIVRERIYGSDLSCLKAEDNPERTKKLEEMCCGLADYFSAKFANGGPYMSDQKLEQYVYGHTASDSVDRVYWVDLDWSMGESNPADQSNHGNWFLRESIVPIMVKMLEAIEKKCKTRFPLARNKMSDLVKQARVGHPNSRRVQAVSELIA